MTSQLLDLSDYRFYHAIIVVAVSLFARFLVSLYKNRRRMLTLKKEGLVSIIPTRFEGSMTFPRCLTGFSACHLTIRSSVIYLKYGASCLRFLATLILSTYLINSDANILIWAVFSIWICGRSALKSFLPSPRLQPTNSYRNINFPKQTP